MPGNNELSERELEILTLVARGASNKEIAQTLFISANTVKVHLRNIFSKIEVTSRTEAAMYAVSTGLVPAGGPELVQAVEPEADALDGGIMDEGEAVAVFPGPSTPVAEASQPARRPVNWLNGLLLFSLAVVALVAAALFARGSFGQAPINNPAVISTPAQWNVLASMPTPRSGLAAATYEGKIYAIAGENAQGITGAVELYDPTVNGWEPVAAKPTPVSDVQAVTIGGLIYVPGGRVGDGEVTDVLEIYDPRADAWRLGSPLPVAASAYALAAFEGRLYLFGGWDGQDELGRVFEYDPGQDAWREKTPMPTSRSFAEAVVAAGRIFVIGGFDGENALAVNEVYWPERDLSGEEPWVTAAPMPQPRYGMGAAAVAETVQVMGGQSEDGESFQVMEYQPLRDAWQVRDEPDQAARVHVGIAPLGTQLFLLGGEVNGEPSAQNQVYQVLFTQMLPLLRDDE